MAPDEVRQLVLATGGIVCDAGFPAMTPVVPTAECNPVEMTAWTVDELDAAAARSHSTAASKRPPSIAKQAEIHKLRKHLVELSKQSDSTREICLCHPEDAALKTKVRTMRAQRNAQGLVVSHIWLLDSISHHKVLPIAPYAAVVLNGVAITNPK